MLLPTAEWTVACDRMAGQLRPGDELLVVCDRPSDPVATREPPEGVELVVAGEPEGCSGKANALACGMERAAHDRLVWTDADFDRGPDWLERLVAAGETYGPATAVPFFRGDGWWRLVEPWLGVWFSLLFALRVGETAEAAWGGGVTFTREELDVPVSTLTAELRTVLSDDFLLSDRLGEVHAVRSLVMPVEVPGDLPAVRDRVVRFVRILHLHRGLAAALVVNCLLFVIGLLYPLVVAPLATVAVLGAAWRLEVRRSSALFAYPGLLVLPVVTLAGMLVREFDWAGRRYRYDAADDVEVLGDAN